ncbi:MAG: hypothetical protein JNM17_39245 [Archangium sp.]|nr:hypothetical protein [Archangium sp.]
MWLSLTVALISSQFREVPLDEFNKLADAKLIHAVATSPNGHTVSVWTRWSEKSVPCLGWTIRSADESAGAIRDTGKKTEGLGEVDCPNAAPTGKRHLFVDTKVMGAPKTLVPVLDTYRNQVALVFPRALGIASNDDGSLLGAWSLGDFSLKGVSIGEHDWLLWVQDAKGTDRLFFVDPALLVGEPLESPIVETVPSMTMTKFAWKKEMPTQQVGPCTLERRGVMIDDSALMLDWKSTTSRIEVRAQLASGEQKVWKVDAAGGTPVAGLDIQRVHFARHGVWRLLIQFPAHVTSLAVSEAEKPKRMSPVLQPLVLGGDATCIYKDGVLRPPDFTLDSRWR